MSKPLQFSDVFRSTVIQEPLKSNSNAIETFTKLIKTCIGPLSTFKIIQNSVGGHITVSTSSIRLFSVTAVKSLILKYIISAVKSHLSVFNNGGLYCCLLTLFILQNATNASVQLHVYSDLNQHFGGLFVKFLTDPETKFQHDIDLTNISQLQIVVCSIINSKPACLLTEIQKLQLCRIVIKAFLNMIPENIKGHVSVPFNIAYCLQNGESPSKFELMNGLLLKCSTSNTIIPCGTKDRSVLVALFSVSLAGDAEFPMKDVQETSVSVWDCVLDFLQTLSKKLISEGVHVVFCQKVVHPSIKKMLESNCVLVFDKLGLEMANNLKNLTGAAPVSSLSESVIKYGLLTDMKTINIGKTSYLFLQNSCYPFSTILLCNYNEEALNETKIVCEQSLDTLFRLLKNPKVCCGGGCSEICVSQLVKDTVITHLQEISAEFDCSHSVIMHCLEVFIASIEDVAVAINHSSKIDCLTDNIHKHLWKSRDGNFPASTDTCQCGTLSANTIPSNQWRYLGNLADKFESSDQGNTEVNVSALPPTVLDELSSKVNASVVAFEASSSLLDIGLCILSGK